MIIIYWISRGFTEGWKWGLEAIPSAAAYHLCRLVEVVAILLAIWLCRGLWKIIGQTLIGIFIYERILMWVGYHVWFKDAGAIFDIGLKIPRYAWQDWTILITGIGLIIYERYYQRSH